MAWLKRLWCSSIGTKLIVALTGVGLFGFVVVHMIGNLLVFKGPEALNAYAQGLRDYGPLLWVARFGLLGLFVIHVIKAIKRCMDNRAARPVRYASEANVQLTFASRTMWQTGLLIFFFVLYHLAHYTFHWVQNTGQRVDTLGRADVYHMVVSGFQNPIVAGTYIIAMLILGLHLSHGLSSVFQTLGLNHPKYNCALRMVGPVVGWAIALGNISMPVAIFLGFVHLAPVVGG